MKEKEKQQNAFFSFSPFQCGLVASKSPSQGGMRWCWRRVTSKRSMIS